MIWLLLFLRSTQHFGSLFILDEILTLAYKNQ